MDPRRRPEPGRVQRVKHPLNCSPPPLPGPLLVHVCRHNADPRSAPKDPKRRPGDDATGAGGIGRFTVTGAATTAEAADPAGGARGRSMQQTGVTVVSEFRSLIMVASLCGSAAPATPAVCGP